MLCTTGYVTPSAAPSPSARPPLLCPLLITERLWAVQAAGLAWLDPCVTKPSMQWAEGQAVPCPPFQRLQGGLVICLPEPSGTQTREGCSGLSPLVLPASPGWRHTSVSLCVPRFGQQCFRSRLSGGLRSFLLEKNKCFCV